MDADMFGGLRLRFAASLPHPTEALAHGRHKASVGVCSTGATHPVFPLFHWWIMTFCRNEVQRQKGTCV